MFFSSTKPGHIAQMVATSIMGEIGVLAFTPPSATEVETFVHIVVQVVVGLVTIYATLRKMFQRPEVVAKVPGTETVAGTPVPAAAPVAEKASTSSDAGHVGE